MEPTQPTLLHLLQRTLDDDERAPTDDKERFVRDEEDGYSG
jgi:hypothetical protein